MYLQSRLRIKKFPCSIANSITCRLKQCYHTYPDPNEIPVITQNKASKVVIDDNGKPLQRIQKISAQFQVPNSYHLTNIFPGVPMSKGITSHNPETISSKLSNGMTVASQELSSLITSIGFIIGTGSSHENQDIHSPDTTIGATHALELTAFGSTHKRDREQIQTEIEKLGGMLQCVGNRESLLYVVDVLRENVDNAIDILADTILNPTYSFEDQEKYQQVMHLQQQDLPTPILSREATQIVAYQGSLGNFHYVPTDKIQYVTNDVINRYRSKYFVSENCCISGVGIEHDHLLRLVQDKFSNIPSIGSQNMSELLKKRQASKYTGGMMLNEREVKEEFIRVTIGFEVGGWHDKDFVATCVLQQLLGGGSSFSSGGPGKGMYTRLYTDVLNQNSWIESCESFMLIHKESGVFGIDGSCTPEYASYLIRAMLDQLVRITIEHVSDIELERAKNMLRSMMMMQLESRIVMCEDIARQFSAYGYRELPHEVTKKIEAISKDDLKRIASKILSSHPSIGGVGVDLSHIPPYNDIQNFMTKYLAEVRRSGVWNLNK